MKSTIFAILVVVLMAGLTLVQMNADTETPFEVLTDAEMFTTQGAGYCPSQIYCIEGRSGYSCSQKDCDPDWSTLTSVKQEAQGYECCSSRYDSDTVACRSDDSLANLQVCATRYHYANPFCWGNSSSNPVQTWGVYTRRCIRPHEPTLV